MARPRVELQTILENLLGTRNVYFQPPENLKLKYPCIVYERSKIHKTAADNGPYRLMEKYTVTYMDSDPDSQVPYQLLELPYCAYDRHFASDNLNHDVFTIFF
jgi:hypothetical protein